MTSALAVTGLCHMITAAGLKPLPSRRGISALRPRQAVLATGGLLGLLAWFGLELLKVTPDAGAATAR
jgi:hypothetical protein